MALAERELTRPTTGTANVPLLDDIYRSLDPADQQTFTRWYSTRTATGRPLYANAWIADQLTAEGYQVSEATIGKARRRGWEPNA